MFSIHNSRTGPSGPKNLNTSSEVNRNSNAITGVVKPSGIQATEEGKIDFRIRLVIMMPIPNIRINKFNF
jgi:hypothetical protein